MVFGWLRRPEAERAEEYRKAASLRGWRLELSDTHFHYSGTTDGIPWTFTAVRHRRRGEVRHPSQWETTYVPRVPRGSSGFLGGAQSSSEEPEEPRNPEELVIVFGRGAEKAARVDLPEVIRNLALRPLAAVLGIDVQALVQARQEPSLGAAFVDIDPIAAVLSPQGIRIVMPIVIQAPEEIERIVRAGVRLGAEAAKSQSRKVSEDSEPRSL